jgi:hypothetical protein
MLKLIFASSAVALCLSVSIPESASAVERESGMRGHHNNVSAARKHTKKLARHAASHQIPQQDQAWNNQAWAGTGTDLAGNSFVYYRTGVGTPFGPASTLRGRY